MKKIVIICVLMLLLIIPVKTEATTIMSASAQCFSEQTVGKNISVTFHVKFNDLKMGTLDTEGVYIVAIEFDFEEDVLSLVSASSDDYVQTVFKDSETGHYGIVGIVKSTDMSNKCADRVLQCGDFMESIQFTVKNTEKTSTNIKIYEYAAGVFKLNSKGEYDINDMKELSYPTNEVKTIKIKQSATPVVDTQTSIIKESKPTITPPKENNTTTTTTETKIETETKSSNKYLKSLTVEGYNIDFKKDKYTYKLNIPSDINNLTITAEPEDSKASYVISGDKDLKANNDKIKVVVTAEDGTKINYKIIVERIITKDNQKETKSIINKLNIVLYSVLSVIVLIIVLVIISSISNKRKLKKLIEQDLK